MTRQRNSLATRWAIYDDHGGEARFWLAWVHGEIDGSVQDWFRTQARHDPALQQDLDSLDGPAARHDLARALEATGYLTPHATTASRPTVVEELDEVTNLVLPERSAPRAPAPRIHAPAPPIRAAARVRGAYTPSSATDPTAQPRSVLRQALDQLSGDERSLLFAQWHARDGCKESLLRVLLPEEDQPPSRGELSEQNRPLRRAEARLRQALGDRRDLLRALGPERLWQLLSEGQGAATNGRGSPLPAPPLPRKAGSRKRRASDAEVYQRVGGSLFKLLAEVEIPLPARDEAGEATRLLQHLVGRDAIAHFRALTGWLEGTRGRMDLASDPSFYAARDRLLLWLAPECFVTDGRRPHFELSFRLYLRARLKDYCRGKNWQPAGPRYRDLETAFRALDRQRIGDIVREAVEEAARAEDQAPALVGVPLAQALQWLQAAP
ncbi:MAG TPA: hypothetical protein VKA46_20250 [Gemmataceae bacterium]|nr:hypothetical protein [Gemmataceae bacterium]